MPGVEYRPERGAGVARGGLHKDILPFPAPLHELDQECVEEKASGQAKIFALSRQSKHRLLDRVLDAARNRRVRSPTLATRARSAGRSLAGVRVAPLIAAAFLEVR